MENLDAALAGFGLGLSLIIAIGAQNAFLLRQGLLREHVFLLSTLFAVSDAVLIAAGVAGFGWVVEAYPNAIGFFKWGGAIFLFVYGAISLRLAGKGGSGLRAARDRNRSLRRAIVTALAFTWLNPHVYLDTFALIGSISTSYPGRERVFGGGAIVASFVFFYSLGFGARLLAPVVAKPGAWRAIDAGIGIVMWAIALKLVLT